MPSSSKMAYTWAGDLSANRSLSSRASSAACSAAVSAAGCGARGPGGALSAAGTGLRWRAAYLHSTKSRAIYRRLPSIIPTCIPIDQSSPEKV